MMFLRVTLAFIAAVVTTFVLASLSHTQFVLADLVRIGIDVPMEARLATSLSDMIGLAPAFGGVIALALAIGFGVAAGLKRILKPLAALAYPLAGAAALGMALFLMQQMYETVPVAGARSLLGFVMQCVAGAIGGLVFARLSADGRRRP